MRNIKSSIAIFAILSLSLSFIAPLFAGGEDDDGGGGDDNGFDFNIGGGFMAFPVFFPDFDFHRGRALVQMPGVVIPPSPLAQVAQVGQVGQQQQLPDIVADVDVPVPVDDTQQQFPFASEKPVLDEYNGKKVIHLDHGSTDNPFMVYDNGSLHFGLLLGASIIEPHSMVQFNLLSKWQYTRSEWAHRYANNYEDARKMKWGSKPKKAADFDDWEIGDWTRKNGIVGLTLYGGVGWMISDARVGALVRGIWSRTIQKMGESLIRVSFTREVEGGPIARAQAMPLQKIETKFVGNSEDTRVYMFDLTKEDDREALERLLDKKILPAKHLAEELAEDNKGTLLTSRQVHRNRNTHTPFSFGLPFIFRVRFSHHNDRAVSVITNHRNNTDTVITSKAYLKQAMHRHVNGRTKRQGKKWKHFMHTHQHFNRSYAGIVTTTSEPGDKDAIASRSQHLDVQISFSHDNVKVKKVNKYAERISAMIGLNDMMFDTDYDREARIGFVEIVYKLKVGNKPLQTLIENNIASDDIFSERAHDLIDEYFYITQDPHRICDSSHNRLQRRCVRHVREETIDSLKDIQKYLRKLSKDDVKASEKKTAKYTAKIAKELSTNHFVLQTFILSLPPKTNGYGKLEIYGERFLAKRMPVDPNVPHGQEVAPEDALLDAVEDDDLLIVDWNRINAGEEDLGIY